MYLELPAPIVSFVHGYDAEIISTLVVVVVLAILGLGLMALRLRRVSRLYRRFAAAGSAGSGTLEEAIGACMDAATSAERQATSIDQRVAALESAHRAAIQRVVVTRYNAFEDIGGAQSFTVVMLDGERSGLALSGVYSRSDVRVYAKEIKAGQPSQPLTREEVHAVAQASASAADGRG